MYWMCESCFYVGCTRYIVCVGCVRGVFMLDVQDVLDVLDV